MDMYSLGVVLFVMLTGHKPMKSEEARTLAYSKYEADEYPKMDSWTWKRLSKQAQSLVLQLIERNPLKRLTAEDVRTFMHLCAGVHAIACTRSDPRT